jgi:hypothetical protein
MAMGDSRNLPCSAQSHFRSYTLDLHTRFHWQICH